jgi:hypothetical protein
MANSPKKVFTTVGLPTPQKSQWLMANCQQLKQNTKQF